MATGGAAAESQCDEYFDVECTLCLKDDKHREAKHYCYDCKKNFCVTCITIHDHLHDDHNVIEGHEEDKQDVLLTEKCDKHPGEIIKFYCPGHDEIACCVCGLMDHRACEKLEHISESNDILNKDPTIKDVSANLMSALKNIDTILDAVDNHLEELLLKKQGILHDIKQYAKQLVSKIEELQKKAEECVIERYVELEQEVNQRKDLCKVTQADITRCVEGIHKSEKQKVKLFVVAKKGQALCKYAKILLQENHRSMRNQNVVFELNLKIKKCLNSTSLIVENEPFLSFEKNLWKASLRHAPPLPGRIGAPVPPQKNVFMQVKKARKTIPVRRIKVSVVPNFGRCCIAGCCLLPDGRILFADSNNIMLILVDPSSGTVIDFCQMDRHTEKLTHISLHEVAACSGGSSTVQIVSHSRMLQCSRIIEFGHAVKCIVADSSGEMFVTDGTDVYAYDQDKTHKKTLYQSLSWKSLQPIKDLAISDKNVYIAHNKHGVICIDKVGAEVFRCSKEKQQLLDLSGLAIDHEGNVLVCGSSSQKVVKLSNNGQVADQILSSAYGVKLPVSMCYNVVTHKLYMGGDCSELLEFDLSS